MLGLKFNHVNKRSPRTHVSISECNVWYHGKLIIWPQLNPAELNLGDITIYLKKYAHGFVVLCFVVVMQSFIMNSREVFIHIHQGCFAGTGAIVRLPQCQWSKPDGYGKISQCITTTKHIKAKTVCIFLGIYCIWDILHNSDMLNMGLFAVVCSIPRPGTITSRVVCT